MKKLRVVQVVVQAVAVLDDGETLTPVELNPVTVPAAEWPSYPSGQFARDLAALEAQFNA